MSKRAREKVIDALFTNGHPYVALEAGPPFNFRWELAQVREIIRLWDVGVPICDIADQTDRDPDEVAVLIIDLARREIISGRRRKEKREGAAGGSIVGRRG